MAVNFQVLEAYHAVAGVRLGITQAHVRYANREIGRASCRERV